MGSEAQDQLLDRFHEVIDYFRREYEITYVEVLGVLAVMRREVEDELMEESDKLNDNDQKTGGGE